MAVVNEQIVIGRAFRKLVDQANNVWMKISFWTKASDVEFDDGKNAEEKFSELKKFVSDGKALLANAITGKKSTVASDATFEELADAVNNIKLGQGNAVTQDVLLGKTFTNDDGELLTGTMPNRGNVNIVLDANKKEYTIPLGYHLGSGKVSASNLVTQINNAKKMQNVGSGVLGKLKINNGNPRLASVNLGSGVFSPFSVTIYVYAADSASTGMAHASGSITLSVDVNGNATFSANFEPTQVYTAFEVTSLQSAKL